MPEKQLCAAPSLTKHQGWRKAALLASKTISSPGMLCGHRAPLLSGGSQPQHCSANVCHLPAGCSPVHSMSPLALPGDKDQKGAIWFSFPHSQRAAQETCHPQISSVTGTPRTSCRCRSGQPWGTGKTFCSAPGTGRKQSWRQRGKPRAAGSRRWGPAGCTACRNARLLEPQPQGCSTGPAPAGDSLGKTRQG